MNPCIVTYARDGRERYSTGVPRLIATAQDHGYTGGWLVVAPGAPAVIRGVPNRLDLAGAIPEHREVPYGFKPELVHLARAAGHDLVLWCDSTIVFCGRAQRAFEKIAEMGLLVAENAGIPIPWWTSDDALTQASWPTDDLRSQCMACILGFDFTRPRVVGVFEAWRAFGRDGVSFAGRSGSARPEFRAHRHDQSMISILAHQQGFPMLPYGFLTYWADRAKHDCVLSNRGLTQP